MDIKDAGRIGSRQAFKAVTAGLVIAYGMMTCISQTIFWIADVSATPQFITAIIAMFLAAWFFGRRAGIVILINGRNKILWGIIYGFMIVWAAVAAASLIGLLQNLGKDENVFTDYMLKPLLLITMFGGIPIILVGIWFGWSIGRSRK